MGGHVDSAEHTHDSPVVSLSLGRSAIFLLGGATGEERPCSMLLHSGTAVMFGGPSRLRFHGVSRVLGDSAVPPASGAWQQEEEEGEGEEDVCAVLGRVAGPVHVRLQGLFCPYRLGGRAMEGAEVEVGAGAAGRGVCEHCGAEVLGASERRRLVVYLRTARINVNIRQMFPDGHPRPGRCEAEGGR